MKPESFLLKGDLCYSKDSTHLETVANGVLVCLEGRCAGVFPRVPEQYQGLPRYDFSGRLVVPGLVDLHVHAPQYAYRGLGMDMELLDWLNTNAFPEEAKFADRITPKGPIACLWRTCGGEPPPGRRSLPLSTARQPGC